MVKDAISKQVVSHLQPAGALTKVLASVTGGPLGALDAVSSVAANAQLIQIKSLLETLQTVATIGAAASVLNLGVSIGGFALVLSKLRAMDAKLDGIARQLDAIARTLDTDFRAKGYSALNRAESAFELSSSAERKRYWQEAERDLDYLVQHSFQKLVGLGLDDPGALAENSRTRFVMAGTISSHDARDALHWLLACAGARIDPSLPGRAACRSEARRQHPSVDGRHTDTGQGTGAATFGRPAGSARANAGGNGQRRQPEHLLEPYQQRLARGHCSAKCCMTKRWTRKST